MTIFTIHFAVFLIETHFICIFIEKKGKFLSDLKLLTSSTLAFLYLEVFISIELKTF